MKRLSVKATPVKARELEPGDLFSTLGRNYWDCFELNNSIGERCYIRTESPAEGAPDADADVFRLTVSTEEI